MPTASAVRMQREARGAIAAKRHQQMRIAVSHRPSDRLRNLSATSTLSARLPWRTPSDRHSPESEPWQLANDQHDPAPEPWRVSSAVSGVDRAHNICGNALRRTPQRTGSFEARGHRRIHETRLQQHDTDALRPQPMSQTLRERMHHRLRGAVRVVARAAAVACGRSEHGKHAVALR